MEHPDDSIASSKHRETFKYKAGHKPEHILSDDSVLKGFLKGEFHTPDQSIDK